MSNPLLSVVIPAHNEEKNITKTIESLYQCLSGAEIPLEIVVVNDNSTDNTLEVLQRLSSTVDCIKIVSRAKPKGFGRAIRDGIDNASGEIVVFYMADASDNPSDVISYYEGICRGYDCVFGSRFIAGSSVHNYPKAKLIINRIVNKIIQIMFFTRFNDLTNAFKAYKKSVLLECGPYKASHFNITIELSLNALIRNYNIRQIPIHWEGRTWGSSSLHLHEMGRRYLSTLLKIFFEKILIRDDLIDEALTIRSGVCQSPPLSARISALESRLDKLERKIQ